MSIRLAQHEIRPSGNGLQCDALGSWTSVTQQDVSAAKGVCNHI